MEKLRQGFSSPKHLVPPQYTFKTTIFKVLLPFAGAGSGQHCVRASAPPGQKRGMMLKPGTAGTFEGLFTAKGDLALSKTRSKSQS